MGNMGDMPGCDYTLEEIPPVPSAYFGAPAGLMESVRSYYSIHCVLPRNLGGSAPASLVSRPAQRSLTLRPACSPSRLNDLLPKASAVCCLHRCSDCYRVERTSSRAGVTPAVDHHLFTAHEVTALIGTWRLILSCQRRNRIKWSKVLLQAFRQSVRVS